METTHHGELDALLVRLSRLHPGPPHPTEQLGLLYVGTYANAHGYRVRVLDQPELPLATLSEITAASAAKVVGFYVDRDNLEATMTAIRRLKGENEALLLVAGGPQVAAPWDERLLLEGGCDIAVRGEGEFAFVAILDWYLKQEPPLLDVEGLTFLDQGRVRRTVERDLCLEPDLYPVPDRTLYYWGRQPAGTECLITSRGCPQRCALCYHGNDETSYRPREMSRVLAEVEMLLQHRRPSYLNILDETFTVNPARVQEFCRGLQELQRSYYPVRWYCEGRPDVIVKHPGMIREMVAAGLDGIRIGVESGNQRLLGCVNELRLDEIREAVRICCDAEVRSLLGNYLIGGAFEGWQSIEKNAEFAE